MRSLKYILLLLPCLAFAQVDDDYFVSRAQVPTGNSIESLDNLVGYYDWTTEAGADGSALGNKADGSGSGNTLTVDGDPTVHVATVDGVKEAGFDGAADEFKIASPTFKFTPNVDSFSVVVVFGEDKYGLNDAICGFGSSGTIAEWGVKSVNTVDRIRVVVGGTESSQLTLTGTIQVVVFVSDGTNTDIYINGSSTPAETITNGSTTSAYSFTVGEWDNGLNDLTGSIRIIGITSDELTTGEVAAIMSEFYQS